jgi:iron(III) transport system permease protein
MISCLWLVRPGVWRSAAVAALLVLAALPALPLLGQAMTSSDGTAVGGAFGRALSNSGVVALLVAVAAWFLGLPGGVLVALYEFPARKVLLAFAALPLLVPSFLWAIGWSALTARLGPQVTKALSGYAGCVVVFTTGTVPLVLLTSFAATGMLSGSQVDAARLAGGEWAVFRHACRHGAPAAGLAAGLGGVLTLSDPGPGFILGLRTAAAEILTSSAGLADPGSVGIRCLALSAAVLVTAAPLACLAAPQLADELLARQTRNLRRSRHGAAVGVGAGLLLLVLLGMILPLTGLILPLFQGRGELSRSLGELNRTGADTLLYAGGSGAVAAVLGLTLGFCVGRGRRLGVASLAVCLVLFALPPALAALGIARLAAAAPAWADPLLRSRLTVCLALGLHFFPVAAVLGLRAWGSMPSSWALAAGVHGVPLGRYVLRVVLPHVLPSGAVAALLVGLLATADVDTVLLLHPPGRPSLPLAIFTVMSNAPEGLVASLCLIYVATAAGSLTLAWVVAGRIEA